MAKPKLGRGLVWDPGPAARRDMASRLRRLSAAEVERRLLPLDRAVLVGLRKHGELTLNGARQWLAAVGFVVRLLPQGRIESAFSELERIGAARKEGDRWIAVKMG